MVPKRLSLLVLVYLSFQFYLYRAYDATMDGNDRGNLTPATSSSPVFGSELSGSSRSRSLECRIKWDLEKKIHLTNNWLEMELPILISVIRHDRRTKRRRANNHKIQDSKFYRNAKEDLVYIIFTQRHGMQRSSVMDFRSVPWKCLYGRGEKEDRRDNYELATFAPHSNHGKDDIILMCNATIDNPTLLLKGVSPTVLPSQTRVDPKNISTTRVDVTENVGNHHHTDHSRPHSKPFIYNLETPLECDRLQEQETAHIHGKKKIGACLRFKGDFDRSLVPEWIEYHRIIGVEHFWVYINEEWNLTGLFNRSYITYLPFDLNWENHASHFPHHFNDYKPKISQEPASWSCLYNARKYGYDWVTTTDVDEYIRVPITENKKATVSEAQPPSLQSYMARFDPNSVSSLLVNQIPFGSNKWLENPDYPPNHLTLDYVWRRNMNLSDYPLYRYKHIYNPQHVWSFGVHNCLVADGAKGVEQRAENGFYLQHYKLANQGVYRKFEKKMVESEVDLLRDTYLRDLYRSKVFKALEKKLEQ